MTQLAENIRAVKQRIAETAAKIGRKPESILLVAVAKTQTAETVEQALQQGITDWGENKVQEAAAKLPLLTTPYHCFHFIGHLQTNKVKALLKLKPGLIHSVDSLHLAREISVRSAEMNRVQDILLQVNTSGEGSKSGCEPQELITLAKAVCELPNLKIKGLMTIGRLSDVPEDSRQDFRLLKSLFEELQEMEEPVLEPEWLSMGMTNDYIIAIEEGANLVRIGSAIFGARHY